jgi:hypothetical protein
MTLYLPLIQKIISFKLSISSELFVLASIVEQIKFTVAKPLKQRKSLEESGIEHDTPVVLHVEWWSSHCHYTKYEILSPNH